MKRHFSTENHLPSWKVARFSLWWSLLLVFQRDLVCIVLMMTISYSLHKGFGLHRLYEDLFLCFFEEIWSSSALWRPSFPVFSMGFGLHHSYKEKPPLLMFKGTVFYWFYFLPLYCCSQPPCSYAFVFPVLNVHLTYVGLTIDRHYRPEGQKP